MITREIKLPENYKKYFKTENDIINALDDYVERKQDKKTKLEIENSVILKKLDKEFKIALWIK